MAGKTLCFWPSFEIHKKAIGAYIEKYYYNSFES
ncbi:hypothetical protein HC231_04215 [Brenneria izadpanahii]|uniref:Transposase n=1 Tax=Brenneria izadpanahii TaxID=2722756 RepID=A0ABX7UNL8_9GAMM|nr:hypothetical protein HC231_04215 [Brenneria izadpanahii]